MSYQYDRYLAQHKSNVEAGFRWLQKNLPEITEGSGAEHNIVFAHYLNCKDWMLVDETEFYYRIINKNTGVIKSVDKFRRVRRRKNHEKN